MAGLEPLQGFFQGPGQGAWLVIGVAGDLLGRLQRRLDAEVAADQGRGDGEVRAGVGPRQAVLDPPVRAVRDRHPQAAGPIVIAPLHIDRRRMVRPHPPERIDVGRQERRHLRQEGLQAADEMAEHVAVRPARVGEQVLAGLLVDQRDVQVHGAARLVLHRLGHEGGIDAVLQRHLAHDALEHQHLVGQAHRVAVQEVDLQLGGARFMDQGVDRQARRLGIFVDRVDQVFVFCDRFQAIGLGRGLGPARAAGGRRQRQVRVRVEGGQVEFQLGSDHRSPAPRGIERHHRLQHLARRRGPGRSVRVQGVGEDIGRRRLETWRDAQGLRVRPHDHVRILIGLVFPVAVGVFAGHRHREHAGGQAQRAFARRLDQLGRRQHLAAQNAVDVGDQALDLADAALLDPGFEVCHAGLLGHLRAVITVATIW